MQEEIDEDQAIKSVWRMPKASGAEEGRGKLRKAAGSRKQTYDPQISECGNAPEVNVGYSYMNT